MLRSGCLEKPFPNVCWHSFMLCIRIPRTWQAHFTHGAYSTCVAKHRGNVPASDMREFVHTYMCMYITSHAMGTVFQLRHWDMGVHCIGRQCLCRTPWVCIAIPIGYSNSNRLITKSCGLPRAACMSVADDTPHGSHVRSFESCCVHRRRVHVHSKPSTGFLVKYVSFPESINACGKISHH